LVDRASLAPRLPTSRNALILKLSLMLRFLQARMKRIRLDGPIFTAIP
jgi:hypothetical protein